MWVLMLALLGSVVLGAGQSAQPVLQVRLVAAKPAQSVAQEVVTGTLAPSRMLALGFELGGRLKVSKVVKGAIVREGQLLGSLDTEMVDAQLAQAEAGLMAAEAAASLTADIAGRQEGLNAAGTISEVTNRSTQTQAKQAQAQLKSARAGLAQARAARRRHDLKAPFAGTIIEAPDQVGGMVGPGTPVYILQQLHPLILKTTVTESIRASLSVGLKVRVESVNSTAATDEATIRLILPTADPQSRRIPLEVVVPNTDKRFVANTLARARLPLGKPRPAFKVPATAVSYTAGEHVFVVDARSALKRVPVTVVERGTAELTVVSTQALTTVVDYPSAAHTDGAPVKVK